ncbi:MAG: hypothetical protein IPK94_10230 [Saprospiraceae bacterium]|nr:hypothetical protein [Saprospiraceae bacterium]
MIIFHTHNPTSLINWWCLFGKPVSPLCGQDQRLKVIATVFDILDRNKGSAEVANSITWRPSRPMHSADTICWGWPIRSGD